MNLATAEATVETARCRHFGECGGCQFQNLSYPAQLKMKAEGLAALFEPIGWKKPIPVHPSPDIWFYRNKMEFSFQDVYPVPPLGNDYLFLGLKRRARWDKVLNLHECFLMSPETAALLEAVHAWVLREKLEPYNLHRQVGLLRHLVVREARNTKDRMVNLVTTDGEIPKDSFLKAVKSAYPATTVLWGVNRKKGDVARSDRMEILEGPGTITEKVLGKKFRISPNSFFQTNTHGAEALYSKIKEWLSEIRPENLLDLYCGSGGISLCVSDVCGYVFGIEEVSSAVADAKLNAAENEIRNAEFLEARVEDILPLLASKEPQADVVLLDPPRSGLHPAAAKALVQQCPKWILYVSCNPKSIAGDLQRFAECYTIQKMEAVDMFPHTGHVEMLALLKSAY